MKKALLTALCVAVLPVAAGAQTEADSAFARCGTISDSQARLACYDGARDQAKGLHWPEFSNPPANVGPARPQALAPRTAAQRPVIPPSGERRVARVAQYSFSPHGQFTIVLDNGEVWRQLDSDDGAARFRHAGENIVQISRGFWGSYDLKLNAANIVFKVTRVR